MRGIDKSTLFGLGCLVFGSLVQNWLIACGGLILILAWLIDKFTPTA